KNQTEIAIDQDNLKKEQTIDSIYTTQKEMKKTQDKIYETIKNDPLKDKKYGIDLNPFRLLFLDKDSGALSGGFSIFNNKKDIEHYFSIFAGSESPNIFMLDYRYRYYLGNSLNGFYICGFSRYAHINEEENYYYEQESGSASKLGIGFGVGYKIFSYKGFYWGTTLGLGRYFIGDDNAFYNCSLYDDEIIFIFEILKIGLAF
ncbi:MAG: hypothetical protein U9P79_04795, partial [Candidatus Cloacimonadota bacterium]|nr:hypothetical protein [Candidatus Cloacimonadota bacterium]